MKRTITKTVPGYKWVVESLCEPCQADCLQQTVPPGADVPPPPKAGAKVLLGVPAAGLLSTTPGMTDVYESGLSDVD